VVWAADLGIYGNCIVLDHGYALQSIYGHMRQIDAKVGDMVKKGQKMGIAGQTGLAGGVHVHFSMQIDGIEGSAIAGLRECRVQHRVNTPRPTWNPDIPNPFRFREQWQDVPDNLEFENAFKVQWEMFLRHIAAGEPFPHTFRDGARGVQLAELGLESWQQRRWIDIPELES